MLTEAYRESDQASFLFSKFEFGWSIVNKNVNSLKDEKREMITHGEKIDKGEVQMILTNSFAFAFGGKISIGILADKIHKKDVEILVGSNFRF